MRGPQWLNFVMLLAAAIVLRSAHSAPVEGQSDNGFTYSLEGKLLVASPRLMSNVFKQSVVLMIEHNESGAFGLIVNKPLGIAPKKRVYTELGISGEDPQGTFTIFYGGPVAPNMGFVIHDSTLKGLATRQVGIGLSVSDQKSIVEALAAGVGPRRYAFVVGYTGWAAGQLESELRRNDWVTAPLDRDIVLDHEHDTKWKRATQSRYRNL
ncbi:MAG: YqgE/AlgH family protein [Pseudomonadota bacterium]|nr:YqgE/AlgH family protein [Pseudomonadota bacterium]